MPSVSLRGFDRLPGSSGRPRVRAWLGQCQGCRNFGQLFCTSRSRMTAAPAGRTPQPLDRAVGPHAAAVPCREYEFHPSLVRHGGHPRWPNWAGVSRDRPGVELAFGQCSCCVVLRLAPLPSGFM